MATDSMKSWVSAFAGKRAVIVFGDADGVKPEHAMAMFELRGGGDEEAAASGMLQKVPAPPPRR